MERYIPWDKSWLIRIGVMDLARRRTELTDWLGKQFPCSADLASLFRASEQWRRHQPIEVGESATLYRFLLFLSWSLQQPREFILSGSLRQREITTDPKIVDYSLSQLLQLDNQTSQWASAALLAGRKETTPANIPFKLQLTYEAIAEYPNWQPRKDQTIRAQAEAYRDWKQTGSMVFNPEQAEDYPFARAFNLISAEEGAERWPSLRGHESDRIAEMETTLQESVVSSKDHRIVQAAAMLGKEVQYPDAVNKSWPLFWQFLNATALPQKR